MKMRYVLAISMILFVNACAKSSSGTKEAIPSCPQPTLNIPQQQISDGKFITPLGNQIKVGPFPDALMFSKDGRHLFVLNSGYGRAWQYWDCTDTNLAPIMQYQSISVIDTTANPLTIAAQIIPGYGTVDADFISPSAVNQSTNNLFQGMILNNAGTEAYAAGGGGNDVVRINMQTLSIDYTYTTNPFPDSVAISPGDSTLYVAEMLSDTVSAYDVGTGTLQGSVDLDSYQNRTDVYPYALVISKDGKYLFVAEQGTDSIDVIDTASYAIVHSIPVGSHPEAFALTGDGSTLYVANTNNDTISVISVSSFTVTATINLSPYANAPDGSMPVSLALSPDNSRLYVALAGENAVAVITTSTNTVGGRIPTAWYPAAVAVSPDGNTLYVANANGVGAGPNIQGQYIGAMIQGSLSSIPVNTLGDLSTTTQQVAANNCPYAWEQNNNFQWNKLKHVVFIIRENKTYDSYFGDLGRGNGDPALAIYGKTYTPNSHALADRFCLTDNFYAEGQSSVQGHQWLKGANSTDFVEKTWIQDYSGRGLSDPLYVTSLVIPDAGYFFEYLLSLGISFRNYGEFVNLSIPALLGQYTSHVYPWPGFNLGIKDTTKASDFIQELNGYIADGQLPQFIYIWLPNDHTEGISPGNPTPQSFVADNDAGLGMIVDALTHSPFWKDMVIFVTEDDPQGVMDHVDAMRMYSLVISPYAKKGYISNVHYSLSSMFKTTEQIFGIKPLSQFDAYANPMADCFTPTADFTPYTALPMGVPFTYNSMSSPGARTSIHLDFTDPDNPQASQEMQALQWLVLKGKKGYRYYMSHKPPVNPNDD
jgi:YVTN family beta-propeller protein